MIRKELTVGKRRTRLNIGVLFITLVAIFTVIIPVHLNRLHASSTSPGRVILKNVSVFLPSGTWLENSFIIMDGAKIEKIGKMGDLKPSDPKNLEQIFDFEYDLKGNYVYPAFIDPWCRDFQAEEPKQGQVFTFGGRRGRIQTTTPDEPSEPKSLKERNFFILKKNADHLKLDENKAKELIANGFSFAHIIPTEGIVGGTSTVISLVSTKPEEAILVPERFLTVFFHPGFMNYPSTEAGVIASLQQLKEDSFYYRKTKDLTVLNAPDGIRYSPELDVIYPYFTKEKRFLFYMENIIQQRIMDIFSKQENLDPALAGHPEVWRRSVKADSDLILPLELKPGPRSIYSNHGEKNQKEAEETLFPEKIAEFIKSHKYISLAAPSKGNQNDYKTLFDNIRTIMKKGVTEADIIRCLTVNPAKLLDISKYAGSIEPGKLASITVFDQKIENPEARVKLAFVEGKPFEFKAPEKRDMKDFKRDKKDKPDKDHKLPGIDNTGKKDDKKEEKIENPEGVQNESQN